MSYANRISPETHRILDAIREQALTVPEICKETGLEPTQVYPRLQKAMQSGRVVVDGETLVSRTRVARRYRSATPEVTLEAFGTRDGRFDFTALMQVAPPPVVLPTGKTRQVLRLDAEEGQPA
jgi:hypothetical protein